MFNLYGVIYYGLLINIVNMPFDKGTNKEGSPRAYNYLKKELNFLNIYRSYGLTSEKKHHRNIFGDGFMACWKILNENKLPLLIGTDHSCAISSVFASNQYCISKNKNLGVLWCDARADFNTIVTSPSNNIHGVPVAILCGHTLPILSYGKNLEPEQFLYYGVRSIDSLEFYRFQQFNMNFIDYTNTQSFQTKELNQWIQKFDKIHLSFDMDCFDEQDFGGVNTHVKYGPKYEDIINILREVKKSNKLLSMDLVEYNPTINTNNSLVFDVFKTIF